MYVCMNEWMYVCMHACMHAWMYVCMCQSKCVCVCVFSQFFFKPVYLTLPSSIPPVLMYSIISKRPWESLFSLEKPPKRMTFIRIHLQGVVLLLLRSVVHQQYTTPPGWLKSLRFFSSNFCYPKSIQEIISLMFCSGSLPPDDWSRVISWWSGMGGMFGQLLAWHEDLATWYVKIWR